MTARLVAFLRLAGRNWTLSLGLILLALVALAAIGAPWFYPDDPWNMVGPALRWPGQWPGSPLGTDSLGRDIAAGIFHGARVSLMVGFVSIGCALVVGILVGAFAGYYGGRVDDVLMRVTELFQTIPQFMLAIVIVAILGASVQAVILSLGVVSWPTVARLVRGEFLVLRERPFVQGCVVVGMSDLRIIFGQILPNCLAPIIVSSSVLVATAIITEASLSFLGLGDPNVMSWGTILSVGRPEIRAGWYMTAFPALALVLTVLALNLIGDALNDVLNPRLKERT